MPFTSSLDPTGVRSGDVVLDVGSTTGPVVLTMSGISGGWEYTYGG